MLSRRSLLSGAGAMAALAACGKTPSVEGAVNTAAQAAGQRVEKVGIQTYTLRKALNENVEDTYKMIKEVGYDFVELNRRNWADKPALELKALLNDIGLPTPAAHISYDDVAGGDISALEKNCKIFGFDYAVVPYMAENMRSLADWKRHAKVMNTAGAKLKDSGTRLAYHNHQFEFDDLGGGTTALEILMNETAPENLDFELDIFWAALASIDIAELMRRYPGRFKLCHIKDMIGEPKVFLQTEPSYEDIGTKYMVNVGEGDIDFEAIFALNEISGMEYFITEHDQPKMPYRGSIKTSLDTVRGLRF